MATPSFVKVFASPGIDSHPSEQGIFNSGAGFDPSAPTLKTPPYDWGNEVETFGLTTGNLVGNFGATKSQTAKSLSIRKRGLSPWSGTFLPRHSQQHPGGTTDLNPGADSHIAGGPGAASSMCRVSSKFARSDRAMKLPVLPQATTRGGIAALPSGGGSHDALTAPLQPQVSGWPTIFKFTSKAAAK